jgi:Leucine-rich repeat (LRR) protein
MDTKVTDAGLRHLNGLTNLRSLNLSNTQVTNAGLEYLNGLSNLRDLDLRTANVTEEGAKKLQQALPNCKKIRFIRRKRT